MKKKYRKRIPVSKILDQLWCERRLELKLIHGVEVKTRAMKDGEKVHMEISSRSGLPKPHNFIDWLGYQLHLSANSLSHLKNRGYAREIFLVAYLEPWRGYVTGCVDEVRLIGTKSQIVEIKTTKSTKIPENSSHRLQAMLYHRILDVLKRQDYSRNLQEAYNLKRRSAISEEFAALTGIEGSVLKISNDLAAKIRSVPELSRESRIVYRNLTSGSVIGEKWVATDNLWLEEMLKFARAYWDDEREAQKTRDRWKCRYCEVRDLCNQNIFI